MCGDVYKCFFFQAEDGIRDLVRSRGLGDVYKRQAQAFSLAQNEGELLQALFQGARNLTGLPHWWHNRCLLYTSDAADDLLCVDLGGRRNIKKKITPSRESITLIDVNRR